MYAVKVVDLKKIEKIGVHLIKREISVQTQFKHPNIIELVSTHQDNEKLYLIMEYSENGALFDALFKNKLN